MRTKSKNKLEIIAKNIRCQVYYTLYTPDDFNFEKAQYKYPKNNKLVTTDTIIDNNVEIIYTYNSKLIRIMKNIKYNFGVTYSFKPATQSIIATKIALATLLLFSSAYLSLHIVDYFMNIQLAILDANIKIEIFVIGGSLILAQLSSYYQIRQKIDAPVDMHNMLVTKVTKQY